jgi:formate dehydrogenase assembly factor FdhD
MLIVNAISVEIFKEALSTIMFYTLFAATLISILYYVFNKTLTLGFVESSGIINSIRFKRSFIENMEINQEEAKKVCYIIQKLIEFRNKRG